MFWSLILEPGKKYFSTVKKPFHLSMAAVDTKSIGKNENNVFPVQVDVNGQELILCNLSNNCLQTNLDLMFGAGSKVTFLTPGKATVHLTGYLIQDDYSDDNSSNEDSDEASESDEVEDNAWSSKIKPKEIKLSTSKKDSPDKRKLDSNPTGVAKKAKLGKEESSEDDDDDDDDISDLEDEMDDSELGDFSLSDADDDENDTDDNEDDESDVSASKDSDDDQENDKTNVDAAKKKKDSTPASKSNKKTPIQDKKVQKTPVSNKKSEDKLNKSSSQQMNGVTPKSEKKAKKKNTPKSEVKAPKGNESSPATPSPQKKQTIEGGVIIEELKGGNGPLAKPGKLVAVYYTGRLKSNNRVFDQSNSGPGFKFRLGRGEVIKGWDVALNGMKVGSKRRITCPPAMAYGAKGSPPSIPPNSSLVFDVELRSVH